MNELHVSYLNCYHDEIHVRRYRQSACCQGRRIAVWTDSFD